jgi:hypothetical protein
MIMEMTSGRAHSSIATPKSPHACPPWVNAQPLADPNQITFLVCQWNLNVDCCVFLAGRFRQDG